MTAAPSYLIILITLIVVTVLYGAANFISWFRIVGWFRELGYKAFPWNWRVLLGRDPYYRWLLAHDEKEFPPGE